MKLTRLFFLIIPILICSCSRYQYHTFSSDLPKDEEGNFLFENDTLTITYRFNRSNSIVIDVKNKLNELIYVDWEKSSFIQGERILPFVKGRVKMEGITTSWTNDISQFSGTINTIPNRSYIPPKSKISHSLGAIPVHYLHMDSIQRRNAERLPNGRRYEYQRSDSLKFMRSFLYIGNQNDTHYDIMSHHFWVSEIVETLDGSLTLNADHVKTSKMTEGGAILGFFALVGAGVVYLITLDEERNESP